MHGWTGISNQRSLHNQKGAPPLSYPGHLISMVLGQTTTFFHLQSFCPLRKSQHTHTHTSSPCQDLIDLTDAWSKVVTAPNGNSNERKYLIKQLHRTSKMCDYIKKILKSFFKKYHRPYSSFTPMYRNLNEKKM